MAEKEKNNVITYEIFSRVERNEKKNPRLEELPEDFYPISLEWLRKKRKVDRQEYENAKRLIKKIFERRERKIIIMAMHAARGEVLTKNLLPEEKEVFDEIVRVLKRFNRGLKEKIDESGRHKPGETHRADTPGKSRASEKAEGPKMPTKPEGTKTQSTWSDYPLVRSLEDIPRFIGTDEKPYGPVKRGDIINLPKKIVDFLEDKKKVEKIEV